MAFQAPQRQQAQRTQHPTTSLPSINTTTQPEQTVPQPSREWILFSPHPSSAIETGTLSSAHTPKTLGRSQLSELDSIQTRGISRQTEDGDVENDDETEDLDSLDDGLHAFGTLGRPLHDSSGMASVLPAHDGLGTFRGNAGNVQDQFWQHEKHNPQRRRRSSPARRTAAALGASVEELPGTGEGEQEQWRMKRIEEWRLKQSRAIVNEIEQESRRRRRVTNASRPQSGSSRDKPAASQTASGRAPARTANADDQPRTEDEGFWARFTKKVIRDLMGIDDATLCYIFGEDLPPDEDFASSTPRQSDYMRAPMPPTAGQLARTGNSWEERLIARIAKELGILVDQLTEHPGAFSTYLEAQEEHIPYAGLTSFSEHVQIQTPTTERSSTPEFRPTLAARAFDSAETSSHWGVEDSHPASIPVATREATHQTHWEQTLDIGMVINFLRTRFLRGPSTPATQSAATATRTARTTSSTAPPRPRAQPLHRADLIRAHHPLIARSARTPPVPIASSSIRTQAQAQAPPSIASILGRRVLSESSCASESQSSKRTRTRSLGGGVSAARSANYWDWGGSEGMGGWGEV